MVFPPLDPAIKEKVIAAYLSGHGRNQTTRQLNEQGIKISFGSVSNIINAYKREHEQTSQPPSHGPQPEADTTIAGSPLLMVRHSSEQAVSTTNTNSISNINTPRDGGPLFDLLCEDNSTDEEEVIPSVTSYSNLPSSVPSIVSMSLYPNTNIPSNFNPYFNPYQNNRNNHTQSHDLDRYYVALWC